MSLVIAIMLGMFVLSCFANTKKIAAVVVLMTLYYIHLPVAILLTLLLAAVIYYT